MSQQIASFYAKITADPSELIDAAKKTETELEKMSGKLKEAGVSQAAFNQTAKQAASAMQEQANKAKGSKFSFTELSSAIGLASQALQKLKQGYDFAKEGAQLDFTAQKFDRLAMTIGTTGDVLLGKMRDATHGTLSDFEAMASATDLVSLGLVKNERDTIRLSSVVAGLGMDMNQLVLTLANKTTMRFDQLGVSVDGFDEKVQKLKASGMDANAAFTEAFLQQAEKQLIKVGNAADTTLGSFMQFEAELKDIRDESKLAAAEFAGPLVKSLAESLKESRLYKEALGQLDQGLAKQYAATGRITPKMRELVTEYQRWEEYGKAIAPMLVQQNAAANLATAAFDPLVERMDALRDSSGTNIESLKLMSEKNESFLGVLGDVSGALQEYNAGVEAADKQLAAGEITVKEHAAQVAALGEAYSEASKKVVLSIVEMKLAADGWTNSELEAYLRIGKSLGVFTDQEIEASKAALTIADNFVAGFGNMTGVIEGSGKAMDDLAVAVKSTVKPTDEQARKLINLNGRQKDATESASHLKDEQMLLGEGIRSDALPAATSLTLALGKMPPTGTSWDYFFNIATSGGVPKVPGGGGTGAGGAHGGNNAGVFHEASGGMLNGKGLTVVGDSPGGWSPWAEVITPDGQVLNHRRSQFLKDMGLLDGAAHFAYSPGDGGGAGSYGGGSSGGGSGGGGGGSGGAAGGHSGSGSSSTRKSSNTSTISVSPTSTSGGGGSAPVADIVLPLSHQLAQQESTSQAIAVAMASQTIQQTNVQVEANQILKDIRAAIGNPTQQAKANKYFASKNS